MVTALTTRGGRRSRIARRRLCRALLDSTGTDRVRSTSASTSLEGALAIRAMIGVGQIVSGDEARSVTHIGYLVASVAVLPLVLNTLEGDRSKWSSAILGVAALVVLVVVLRLQVTTGD